MLTFLVFFLLPTATTGTIDEGGTTETTGGGGEVEDETTATTTETTTTTTTTTTATATATATATTKVLCFLFLPHYSTWQTQCNHRFDRSCQGRREVRSKDLLRWQLKTTWYIRHKRTSRCCIRSIRR